jgi:hypothetical protein
VTGALKTPINPTASTLSAAAYEDLAVKESATGAFLNTSVCVNHVTPTHKDEPWLYCISLVCYRLSGTHVPLHNHYGLVAAGVVLPLPFYDQLRIFGVDAVKLPLLVGDG